MRVRFTLNDDPVDIDRKSDDRLLVDVPRTDAPAKVTGGAQYVADLHLPNMLLAAVLRSPHPPRRAGPPRRAWRWVARPDRVAIGAVGVQPILREGANLVGAMLDIGRVRAALCEVANAATPAADVRGSVAYKRAMAVEFAARAVLRAYQRARRAGARS